MITEETKFTPELLNKFSSSVNAEQNPVLYLAIDPGKSNGVCCYDAKMYLTGMYTIRANNMVQFLNSFQKVKKCIIEDFKLYPNKASSQFYSTMETSRVIGRIETWSELNGIELIKQGANIKATGYKWIGKKPLPKSNKQNHELDAHVHFMYWAIKNNHIDPGNLIER